MSEVKVYARHIRAAGYCVTPGGKDWFEQHSLDWRDFVKNGIPLEKVECIDDELCRRVCKEAIKEYSDGPNDRI